MRPAWYWIRYIWRTNLFSNKTKNHSY